jgi:hypothetical protein
MRAWMRSPAAYGALIAAGAGAAVVLALTVSPVPATGSGDSSAQPALGTCPRGAQPLPPGALAPATLAALRQAPRLFGGPGGIDTRDTRARAQLLRGSPAHAGARSGASVGDAPTAGQWWLTLNSRACCRARACRRARCSLLASSSATASGRSRTDARPPGSVQALA